MKRSPEHETELRGDVSALRGWARAKKSVDPAEVKLPSKRITINLDSDIVAIFKAEALHGGPPYQVAINQALRRYLRDREADVDQRTRKAVLSALADPEFAAKVAAKLSFLILDPPPKARAVSSKARTPRAHSSRSTQKK